MLHTSTGAHIYPTCKTVTHRRRHHQPSSVQLLNRIISRCLKQMLILMLALSLSACLALLPLLSSFSIENMCVYAYTMFAHFGIAATINSNSSFSFWSFSLCSLSICCPAIAFARMLYDTTELNTESSFVLNHPKHPQNGTTERDRDYQNGFRTSKIAQRIVSYAIADK